MMTSLPVIPTIPELPRKGPALPDCVFVSIEFKTASPLETLKVPHLLLLARSSEYKAYEHIA